MLRPEGYPISTHIENGTSPIVMQDVPFLVQNLRYMTLFQRNAQQAIGLLIAVF